MKDEITTEDLKAILEVVLVLRRWRDEDESQARSARQDVPLIHQTVSGYVN
jgi:hypothetical protein